jgi:hypothetical protein
MRPPASALPSRRQRGSAFITVAIFTTILLLVAASIITWSTSERRLNSRNGYWLEARNAAEAVAEYGFSQVRNEFASEGTPPSFNPTLSTALVLPPLSFFTNSDIDTNTNSSTDPTSLQLVGGTIQDVPASGALYYVDPNNPANNTDPLKGQWVFRRDIAVMARASAVPPSNGTPFTAYVTEKISVRGAPLFAHAIFYANNDLELFPGPTMNIYGPVHCNGNIFLSPTNGVSFYGPVSCTQNLYHAYANSNTLSWGTGNQSLAQGPVNFSTSAGTLVNLDGNGLSTGWNDSTMGADNGLSGLSALSALVTTTTSTAFRQYASQTYFNGMLQTGSMGVQSYNPVAFTEDIGPYNVAGGTGPSPHAIIEPPFPTASLSSSALTAAQQANLTQINQQKLSEQAGLYITVTVSPLTVANSASNSTVTILTTTNSAGGTPTPPANSAATIAFYGPAGSAPAGTPASMIGPNGGILLNPPANLSQAATTTISGSSSSLSPPLVTYIPFRRLQTTVTKSGSVATASFTLLNAANTVVGTLPTASVSGASGATTGTSYSLYPLSATGTASVATNGTATVTTTGSSLTTTYGSGLYDQRRGESTANATTATLNAAQEIGAIDLVQVDMMALSNAVNAMVTSTTSVLSASSAITSSVSSSGASTVWGSATGQWNGGVYIDVEAPAAVAETSNQTTSVRLVDGVVSSGNSLLPANAPNDANTNAGSGLIIATNAPVYILGNFNASGSGTSATNPDDGGQGTAASPTKECPVAISADAITILSPAWQDTRSLTLDNSTSTNDEIAAALMTGVVATTATSNSGGAHNLPRFLESWSATCYLRGSLVTMYSSEVGAQPYAPNGNGTPYYGAPTRSWGFDNVFANGTFPPLTPKVLSFRRVEYCELPQTSYSAELHQLWPSNF